ncbi:MAG: DUF3363 domain-containing protein [Xanthobacteraceae bacterium]|nr:DUF3363 domain-containing protein [Xanthobacteraceae bacterium]
MKRDDDFRVRPGRIRSSRAQRALPFVAQALAAAQKAGGRVSRSGKITSGRGPHFARGRVAGIRANRLITSRTRFCTVKALVVRNRAQRGPLARHLNYLRRDGVTRDGERAKIFGVETDDTNVKEFTERCKDDRHHFRFIVSPEDATDMEDLKRFTRELMTQMEKDLGTKLEWVAVDHWNTDNPHVHVIVCGRADDGRDLVIDRDYIKSGMRDRAQDLITQELGPRTDFDISRALARQVEAERWTQLDRQLVRDANERGVIDVAPSPDRQPDACLTQKVGRLRHLEHLGLAETIGPGQWVMAKDAEPTLRELGARNDIIKRMHRALDEQGIARYAGTSTTYATNRAAAPSDLVAVAGGWQHRTRRLFATASRTATGLSDHPPNLVGFHAKAHQSPAVRPQQRNLAHPLLGKWQLRWCGGPPKKSAAQRIKPTKNDSNSKCSSSGNELWTEARIRCAATRFRHLAPHAKLGRRILSNPVRWECELFAPVGHVAAINLAFGCQASYVGTYLHEGVT